MFHFEWPWMILLLPLPWLVRWLFPYRPQANTQTPEIYFPGWQRLKELFPAQSSLKVSSHPVFNLLFGLSWLCLVLALMQPERVDQHSVIKNEGYDLMLAVDISGSMQAVDFSTRDKVVNRLDAVKEVVSKFVLDRRGDRIGLVAFGAQAYLQAPLTLDTLAITQLLNNTTAGMAGSATAIGDAIGLSVKILRERPAGSRVLILLTDGEDNSSSLPPLDAAKLAKQYGIRIYTIGVGKKGPVHFPNQFGGYSLVEVPIDEKLLQEIATMTGGHFYRATDQKSLEAIYTQINTLEKSESDQLLFLLREPYYVYFLGAALLCLLLLSLYPLLRRRWIRGV